MTVSTSTNKMSPQVMGSSFTYDFDFRCLTENPTEEEAKRGIKAAISDGVSETRLEYGTDYTVSLEKDGSGGTITVVDKKTADFKITIWREYDIEQGSDYENYNAFPASTMEQNLDKLTMIAQQLQEQAGRSVKVAITGDIDPEVLVQHVERVHQSVDNIDTVANDKANLDTVAENIEDVNTVAGSINNVNTVANNIAAVNNVSSNTITINKVAEDLFGDNNIKTVADDIANVKAVGENINKVSSVANNEENINAVAGNETNITAVAENEANITAVAENETNINAVNSNKENIDAAAENMPAILDAPNKAAAAANSATAADGSATAASNHATAASNSASLALGSAQLAGYAATGTLEQYPEGSAKYWAQQSAQGQVQADWSQTDTTKKDFIKNKPTKLSDFSDDSEENPIKRALADEDGNNIKNTYQTKMPTSSGNTVKLLKQKGGVFYLEEEMTGIPPSYIKNKSISISGNTVSLKWTDPEDSFSSDGSLVCTWAGTVIVKKQGSAPETETDGTVVATITSRNQHAETPLTDTQSNPSDWYYKAFPYSDHGVHCRDPRNEFGVYFFGYCWDVMQSDPATAITYPEGVDNKNYRPSYMNKTLLQFQWGDWMNAPFLPKPCALTKAGVVDYYLDPNDYTKKANGSASDVASSAYNGNFMMEWDTIYRKKFKKDNYIYCYFSNKKLDDGYECWSTKKADGTYADHFYTAIYQGTSVSNVLRSYSSGNKCWGNTGGAANERTQAAANGSGWDIRCASDSDLIIDLYLLMFKHLNSQDRLGYVNTNSSALTINCGAGNNLGMFYGTNGSSALKFFGMENWYSHRWEREVGVINKNGTYYVKHTKSTIDGSTTSEYNLTGDNYKNTGLSVPAASESYIYDEHVFDGSFLPRSVGASSTTYTCDGMWSNNGQVDVLFRGGDVDNGSIGGVLCFHVNHLASYSAWSRGASLSYHF